MDDFRKMWNDHRQFDLLSYTFPHSLRNRMKINNQPIHLVELSYCIASKIGQCYLIEAENSQNIVA